MKPSSIQILCGIAMAAMSAAGASHWWSVKGFVAAVNAGLPISQSPLAPAAKKPAEIPAKPVTSSVLAQAAPKPAAVATATTAVTDPAQKKFYETLVERMERLQNQNRDLLDQMAETNRDLMKLEFRVDTHSESFRPMVVSEERQDTSFDDGPGVLPPRAEPVLPPFDE